MASAGKPAPLPGPAYDGVSAADLAGEAEAAGHAPAERVVTTVGYGTRPGLVHGLLAPLAVGGSAVLCRHADPSRLAARAAVARGRAATVAQAHQVAGCATPPRIVSRPPA